MKYTTIALYLLIAISAKTQHWKIESCNIGWKVFEQQLVGTNPYTISQQLKDPLAYLKNLDQLPNNNLSGFPFVVGVDNYYAGAELYRNKNSKFWNRHRIPLGIVVTGVNQYPTGSIGFIQYDSVPTYYETVYRLFRKIQFFGIHSGLIRKFRLRENVYFIAGIQGQISAAVQHSYRQVYDTVIFRPNEGFGSNTKEAESLAGKMYLQWQLYVPMAFEYHALNKRVGIKAEINYGLLKNPFIGNSLADMESAGTGFTLSYRFKN